MLRVPLAFVLALYLLSEVAVGADLTYQQLKDQLPIQLSPNGNDQYFFFIVPVQKNDEPNVILQMAQAQDKTSYANESVVATVVDTQNNSVYASAEGENVNLGDIFSTPGDDKPSEFNFQVPVVIPMDFRFTYDPSSTTDILPQCTVDSRTWKEKVISRIAEKLDLEGDHNWDHSDLTIRIRLRKDALSGIALSSITSTSQLSIYVNTITSTKTLSDIRYTSILNNITMLTGGHVSIAAEGVDTYRMLVSCISRANTAADALLANGGDFTTINILTQQLDLVQNGTETSLAMFTQVLAETKRLQAEESMEDENGY